MKHVSEILPAIVKPEMKPLTPIEQRLLSFRADAEEIVYQHSVLCQTSMPYRDPGDGVRLWQRENGRVQLELQAGRLLDPSTRKFVDIGLPYGPKPRLVLLYLNTEAIRTRSRSIELEDSLTAFCHRTLGLDEGGQKIRVVKDQLNRLAAAEFRMGMTDGVRAVTMHARVLSKIELWTPRDARQRVLWPTTVQFSYEYFDSLMRHAVPLNEDAVTRLSHSAMALDVYTWLAQRLHRVDPRKPAFVPWASLKDQFGEGYDRMVDFRRFFLRMLKAVLAVYPDAKISCDGRGLTLRNSPPPVMRYTLLPRPR